jgi:4-diphosphocytidyl-2-C-methyl-D-erythritol kinase
MPRSLVLRPSAKINLSLHVGLRQNDGFHEVRTLLQSIALSDTLTVTARRGAFTLVSRAPALPAGRKNLVYRAAEALWRALGRSGAPRDAHIKLQKSIPMAAGLGGGSADAAAALAGLNVAWDGRLSRRDLIRLAAELGSDVPFFLHGGTALGVARGDEVYPVEDVKRLGVVLIQPSFGVSTAQAYGWLDDDRAQGHPHEAAAERGDLDVGWATGRITLANDLQAPVARRHAGIGEMIAALRQQGAQAALMTGSGSVVFGVFSERAAPKAARRLRRPDWRVFVTRTLSRRDAGRLLAL